MKTTRDLLGFRQLKRVSVSSSPTLVAMTVEIFYSDKATWQTDHFPIVISEMKLAARSG